MSDVFGALPTLNASLNGIAAYCLVSGWIAIRKGDRVRHQRWMTRAFVCSTLFLSSYLTYHFFGPGITRYSGPEGLKWVYYSVLLTHTPLATLMVPFILAALYFAIKGLFDQHVKIVTWVTPVWIYVSITGVVIYVMLYHLG